ncbi:MAG: hypothetical protein CVU90_07560, partial [Firmicutes bacterium HGW-Firmicutes-15]
MRIEQKTWTKVSGWESTHASLGESAQLVLLFGTTSILSQGQFWQEMHEFYPNAYICGCSTAGEICDTRISDNSLVCTAIKFDHAEVRGLQIKLGAEENSFQAGKRLAQSFPREGLAHLMVISNGLLVNGSELVAGLTQHLPEHVTVTGGLAADGECFHETLVFLDSPPASDTIVGLGFYGDRLRVGYGSQGGWIPFGPERLITRSQANVLFEMDGKSALDLYKQYLGKHANGLPATAMLFPLSISTSDGIGLVRTVLAIDEDQQSMTFAGDMPEGSYVRLMSTNFERLIDGATGAAEMSKQLLYCAS